MEIASTSDRKRSLPNTQERHIENMAKRRSLEDVATMSLSAEAFMPEKNHTVRSAYGGAYSSSYPVSSLFYSPSHRDVAEAASFGSYSSQSRSSSAAATPPRENPSSAAVQLPSDTTSGLLHEDSNPSMPSREPPARIKRSRFNLSRYQLDDDEEDMFASIFEPGLYEKPNRFKSQRERLNLLARGTEESDEESGSSATDDHEGGEDSWSHDSFMPQRERLRQFRNEQSRHVVIPNEWEGETRLHEFVGFGNIEAALRPLGLMMARAALVSDSVTTARHLRSPSSVPS